MSITLNEFYQYVFGDWANIRLSSLRDVSSKEKKAKEKFSFILKDEQLSSIFRYTLRELNASALETLLFNNNTDNLVVPEHVNYDQYHFPPETEIRKEFKSLNQKYLNSPQAETEKTAENKFVTLFKGFKLFADYVECNNETQNQLAYLHAYKTFLWFDSEKNVNLFKKIEDYLAIHNFQKSKNNIKSALSEDLGNNISSIIDLTKWQQMISKSGPKAIQLFKIADKIDKLLGHTPHNLEEAKKAAIKVLYKRHNEYPELAALCQNYFLPEEDFNKCLEIEKDRKLSDELPPIMVDGSSVNRPGYYLVKLPYDDPIAYLLGQVTNCCQTVTAKGLDNDPTECIISGITLPKNGFYVLLKGDPKKDPLISGKINYDKFKIVGQGYAWWSENDNFTFDSWENLRPQDYTISNLMLEEFGKQLIAQNPEVFRVTVGISNHTTEEAIQNKKRIKSIDFIATGNQYTDSFRQCLVSQNEGKLLACKNAIQSILSDANISLTETEFEKIIPLEYFSSIKEFDLWMKKFESFLKSSHIEQKWDHLFKENSNFFEVELEKSGLAAWEILFALDINQLLTADNFIAVSKKISAEEHFSRDLCEQLDIKETYPGHHINAANKTLAVILKLAVNHVISQENLGAVLESPDQEKLCNGLCKLNEEHLLNKITRLFIIQKMHQKNTAGIPEILITLSKANLLTPNNINSLLEENIDCLKLNTQLMELPIYDYELNQENFSMVLSDYVKEYAKQEEENLNDAYYLSDEEEDYYAQESGFIPPPMGLEYQLLNAQEDFSTLIMEVEQRYDPFISNGDRANDVPSTIENNAEPREKENLLEAQSIAGKGEQLEEKDQPNKVKEVTNTSSLYPNEEQQKMKEKIQKMKQSEEPKNALSIKS